MDISGAVEPLVRDLDRLPGNLIPGLHFLNDLPEVRLFRFISRIHLHGCRYQVRVKQEGLPDDRIMPVLLRGPFLPVSAGQVDLKIIIRTVKNTLLKSLL